MRFMVGFLSFLHGRAARVTSFWVTGGPPVPPGRPCHFKELHVPRPALGAVGPAIRFVVTDDLFGGGVPLEGAVEPVDEVHQVADGDGAGADLDVADGFLAGLDAVDEVL